MKTLSLILLLLPAGLYAQAQKGVEAMSRVYHHKDGTRTTTIKDGDKNKIDEFTYNQNQILVCKREFITDNKGRWRMGYIFDGKLNPLGSIEFGYDPATDQLVEERQYNKDAKLIRRLFYPGVLKDARFGNHPVALIYNPDDQKAKPVLDQKNVQPTRPVDHDQEEFTPGIPLGRGALTPGGVQATPQPLPVTAAPPKRVSILQSRKR